MLLLADKHILIVGKVDTKKSTRTLKVVHYLVRKCKMCDHHHGGDGGCSHEAEPNLNLIDDVMQYDMHQYMDKEKITVLNEEREGSGKTVFKSMIEKTDRTLYVDSDCDEELLFNIPFTGHVKITGMVISGDEDDTHPATVRLFKDRPAMSFDDCSIEADQELGLKMDSQGKVDYPLKANKFGSLTHLTIQISKNFGADQTRVYYIGLRGEYQHEFRQRIAIATYEARAIPKDHKGEIPQGAMREMM